MVGFSKLGEARASIVAIAIVRLLQRISLEIGPAPVYLSIDKFVEASP
jgi:hypothetical protein